MPSLDPVVCYRALRARDPRFDGLFFVGVATTGIYCRPVCPARLPREDRCAYFSLAAEAERAGFRSCLRCRPDLAPGGAPSEARSRLVKAALSRIARGALTDASVDALAAKLDVSARHLRRAMELELGVSPIALETTRRVALGKQLLRDTQLPVTNVAFASGFRSVRRFNAVFAEQFGRPPSSLRSGDGSPAGDGSIVVRLAYRPPLAWNQLLAFLRARAVPGVERVDAHAFERTVAFGDTAGVVRVTAAADRPELLLQVPLPLTPHIGRLARSARDLFDLDARPDIVAEALSVDPTLAPLVQAHPGLRVPGAFDPFEVAVRAVLAQQISVAGATTLSGRIARTFGRVLSSVARGGSPLDRAAPTAEALANASTDALRAIGMPEMRARSLSLLARAVASGELDLEPCTEPERVVERLREIRGIGPFTAQMIAMRVLRDPDAFPDNDLIVRRRLGVAALERAEAWRPFRAYAAMLLWTDEGANP